MSVNYQELESEEGKQKVEEITNNENNTSLLRYCLDSPS